MNDGLGFQNKLESIKNIGVSEDDENYIRKEIQSINDVIGKQYVEY